MSDITTNKDYQHQSVMIQEVLEHMNLKPGSLYIDATFGGGGHTRAMLEAVSDCRVIAIDWDKNALEQRGEPLQQEFPDRLQLIWGSFALLYKLLKKEKIPLVDGILADVGTSQYQITSMHGFSFYHDTPLDMRMSPAYFSLTAQELIRKASAEELRQIFWQLGEEKYAKRIVEVIVAERKKKAIATTKQLADIVAKAVPYDRAQKIHPATRVFQALRIFINHELENIRSFLPAAVRALKPHGRLVMISFHSLEDRIVKNFFKEESQKNLITIVTKRAVFPSQEEIAQNPSARSARLRAAERR